MTHQTPAQWLIRRYDRRSVRSDAWLVPRGGMISIKDDHAGCLCEQTGEWYAQSSDAYGPWSDGYGNRKKRWAAMCREFMVPQDAVPFQGYVA